ncbi:hypothetical protein Tco_1527299 [Tanacetum coccineum]
MYVCPAVRSTCVDTMADMNMHANDVPAEQAPAIAPPTRTDDQILPSSKWEPIDKSNCVLDVQKSQRNPIFRIVVALLKNTNFFRAFTLDEQWFNLHKDILRDALDITPSNDNNPFVAPPSSDTVIEFFRISLIAPTSTMLKGFGKSLFNPYKLSSLTGRT